MKRNEGRKEGRKGTKGGRKERRKEGKKIIDHMRNVRNFFSSDKRQRSYNYYGHFGLILKN